MVLKVPHLYQLFFTFKTFLGESNTGPSTQAKVHCRSEGSRSMVNTKYAYWTGGFGEEIGDQVESNTGFTIQHAPTYLLQWIWEDLSLAEI